MQASLELGLTGSNMAFDYEIVQVSVMLIAKYFSDGREIIRLARLDSTSVAPWVCSHGVANVMRSKQYSFTQLHEQEAYHRVTRGIDTQRLLSSYIPLSLARHNCHVLKYKVVCLVLDHDFRRVVTI